jgi:hypothetical protein
MLIALSATLPTSLADVAPQLGHVGLSGVAVTLPTNAGFWPIVADSTDVALTKNPTAYQFLKGMSKTAA